MFLTSAPHDSLGVGDTAFDFIIATPSSKDVQVFELCAALKAILLLRCLPGWVEALIRTIMHGLKEQLERKDDLKRSWFVFVARSR